MSTRTALVILLLGLSRPAAAGPANSPLPTFADGAPAQAVYAALGVIRNNNLETDVACTSFEATPVDIGFEVFDETGLGLHETQIGIIKRGTLTIPK